MTTTLLIISLFLLTYLSGYAILFLGLSIFALLSKPKSKSSATKSLHVENQGAIAVLIPSHNEGEGLIDAVETVAKQDYTGSVDIYILLNNQKNNPAEISALAKFYNFDIATLDNQNYPNSLNILNKNKRKINLILTGIQSKKDKINYILSSLNQPLTAILDADHRPSANWLSSSVSILFTPSKNKKDREIVAVQTRRRPLSTSHLAQIWDSSQSHLGNELFNNFLTKFFKHNNSVFFTGTAALFKTNILKKFKLSDSVTEDTYLSYDLWCAGYAIAYNGNSVSYEEVSPSFRDYVLRRRRWSTGHSQTFFHHILKIIKSPLSLVNKFIILCHGQFYLVPLVIWSLLSVYGYYFFRQIESGLQIAVLIISFIVAGILSYSFRQKGRRLYGDWLIAFIWILPQFATVSIYYYKLMGMENYYYILIFPYAREFLWWHIGLILAPLTVFLSSFYYFKDSRQIKNLWVLPSYVFMMALDVYAALLGFWDMLIGRSYWSRITRNNDYSANLVEANLSDNFVTGKATKKSRKTPYIIALILIIGLFVANNLLAVNNCGEVKNFLWSPLFLQPKPDVNLKIDVYKKLGSENNLNLNVFARLNGGSGNYSLIYYIDNKLIGEKELAGELPNSPIKIIETNYPLGWQKHQLEVKVEGQNGNQKTSCSTKIPFSTVLKEIKGTDLFINNEKFLIKGLIPSFMNGQIGLELSDGFKQFHDIGVNTIRFYHSANTSLISTAEKNQLLVIDQPNRSNWSELDVTSERQVNDYLDRYQTMVTEHTGQPYILFDGLGNEWELGRNGETSKLVNSTYNTLLRAKNISNWPSTYSTYFTFINYPIDISAVNMLDTGQTYWNGGINVIKNSKKPFYASEFGGFVAFLEKTVPELRMKRMEDEWSILLQNGALGANFYESHDNWAQSVVFGYNDPFKPDQPDDVRGFWDQNNKPKLELSVLKRLLSDLEVKTENETINIKDNQINLIIKNIREYSLQDVSLTAQGKIYKLDDFKAGEEKSVSINWNGNEKNPNLLVLDFRFTSHSGLGGAAQVDFHLPILGQEPLILNNDFISESNNSEKLFGRLLSSNNLDLIIPENWINFIINGQSYSKTSSRMEIPISNPYHDVSDIELSIDGINWSKLPDNFQPNPGEYYFRFHWPKILARKQYLILSGTGTDHVEITLHNKTINIPTHSYRENTIDSTDLDNPQSGELIIIKENRYQTSYINKDIVDNSFKVDNSLKESVNVEFELPRIFAPVDIDIKKIN